MHGMPCIYKAEPTRQPRVIRVDLIGGCGYDLRPLKQPRDGQMGLLQDRPDHRAPTTDPHDITEFLCVL